MNWKVERIEPDSDSGALADSVPDGYYDRLLEELRNAPVLTEDEIIDSEPLP